MGVEWRAWARGGGGGGGWLPFADREIGRSGAVLIWVSQSVVHEVYMKCAACPFLAGVA